MKINLTAVLILLLSAAVLEAADRPPNVVLILADDVGCEPLRCYGGESYPTPNLDKLPTGGMRFRHCYSMAVCHPTRTTLLTGRCNLPRINCDWGQRPLCFVPSKLIRWGLEPGESWPASEILKNDRLGVVGRCREM